ncbi:hypothetical protein Ahy_B07g086452 [Arachis hypogaea]|uniref:Uncharacterized protein n=1 Tax=Arachis hypogaea TaxID=3818 RepID=A0A444Y9Z2_ARAHY|nr:hypothetical protein Ahy_B07g086452 [Arachis hypogaea]
MADELSNVNGGSSANDSIPVIVQQADVTSRSEGVIGSKSIVVTTVQTGNSGRNIRSRGNLPPPPITTDWPPYGLPPGYTPPVDSFVPPVRFESVNGGNNSQNLQQHSEYSRDYNVGSTSNAANSMAVYRQHVEESHHDLVNLLTQQMTTILNPMMADHESKFERLARQVEQIARIIDYEEGERQDARGNNEGFENAELMKKEKEKHKNEPRVKSRPFTRKEKVAYVTMESSEEELDFETEIDLAELKKEAIMEGRLKFDDGMNEMKVDTNPFDAEASFTEPCFGMNIVGISYNFDVALDDFESQVRSVYPRAGDGLLDFLVQQKIKDRDVSLCPRCNAIFDAEVATIFEKERMKKELAHREEQARQRQLI